MPKLTSPESALKLIESRRSVENNLSVDDLDSMFGDHSLHLKDSLYDEYRWTGEGDDKWELVANFANGRIYRIHAKTEILSRRGDSGNRNEQESIIWEWRPE